MGTLHKEMWVSDGSGMSRRQRASGVYYWYLPDKLNDLDVLLESDVVLDVVNAEVALATCSKRAPRGTEGIARILLRSEAVSSSQIEGLVIGSKRLLRAELQEREPKNIRYDSSAANVLANIHAAERGARLAAKLETITVDSIREIHQALCEGTQLEMWGGVIRDRQNWVGGNGSNPLSADYVPPAPQEIPALLEDLVTYANRTDVSAVVQAALCHAQFESIHPFIDGNGRTGRALVQVCLMHRGVVGNEVPPISLALATQQKDYYESLHGMQHHTDSVARHKAINDWVSLFAGAVTQACADMMRIANEMDDLRNGWIKRLGTVRAGSALEHMLFAIQELPYFSVNTMVRAGIGSKQSVSKALERLIEAQIVCQTNRGKRDRIFEAPEVLEQFAIIERRLASPARDTNAAPPVRPVPYR